MFCSGLSIVRSRGFKLKNLKFLLVSGLAFLGACNPQFLSAYNDGDITGSLGETKQTIAVLGDQLAADPENRAALNRRGNAYLAQKEYGLALTDLNQSLALDPNQPEVIHHRATIFQAQGLHELAIAEFSRAISQSGNMAVLYYGRAKSWIALDNRNNALTDFDQAVQRDPAMADAWARRGLMLETLGDQRGARDSFKQALKANKNHRIARAGLLRLSLSNADAV